MSSEEDLRKLEQEVKELAKETRRLMFVGIIMSIAGAGLLFLILFWLLG